MHLSLDSDIIKRVCKGDRAAVGILFERYHPSIFRYLYYKVGDTHTAEDLASEVFLRLLRSISQQRPENVQPQAWLYKIARNLAIDHYRKNQVQQPVFLEENNAYDEAVDPNIDQNLDSQALYKMINTLPFDQREVILLRFINRMPIADVAQVMDRSEDAIKGLQRRALTSLRQCLEEQGITY